MTDTPTTTGLSRRAVLGAGAATSAAALIGGSAAAASAAPRHGTTTARTIIHHARVFTGEAGSRAADAVAIGPDGRILAVGGGREIRRLAGRRTEFVDAAGGTVMAGIHDGHVHPMYAGLRGLNPSLQDAELTGAQVVELVTGFLADPTFGTEPDAWLVVEGWNPAGTPSDTLPDRTILDGLPTARPVALNGSDGHNLWVNTRALDIGGITGSTADPVGGEIVRDSSGRATGVLKDSAQDLVRAHIPDPTPEQMYAAFAGAFAEMAAGGITTAMDAWVDEWQLDFYRALAESGDLPQRVVAALLAPGDMVSQPQEVLTEHLRMAAAYADVPGLRFGMVKVFMDGVIEYPAQTAALLEPYLDESGNPTDHYGDLYVDGPTMGALATAYDAAGWQVHAHAIGDAGVRAALDGYAAARAANGRGKRHAIAHLQLVHPDDYPRFRRLDVAADMQLQWATRNVWTMEALLPFIGPERHQRMYPARSLMRAGALVAGGSDWPVDPLYPWNQVQTAIDRFGIYGEVEPLYPEEGLTRWQSLVMHTKHTARQLQQLGSTGTLSRGKQADLVVLDLDITRCPVAEIHTATPQVTMVGGEVTFAAGSSTGRALRRRMERSAAATAMLGRGRLSHDQLPGRHAGCPCTAGQQH